MKKQEDTTDFIEIYETGFPVPLCNDLVEWFEISSAKGFTNKNIGFGNQVPTEVTIRHDESIGIPSNQMVPGMESLESLICIPGQICQAIFDNLNRCYADYAKKYDMGNMPMSNARFKVHKVKPGEGYHVWHCENSHDHPSLTRVLAWMTYLKVPEEGGETEFLYQSKRIEPIVGRTLIWPAYFTHMHRGNPPLKGVKYYITGWFERVG